MGSKTLWNLKTDNDCFCIKLWMTVVQLAGTCVVVVSLSIGGLSGCAWGQPYDDAPHTLRVMTWNVEWMFDDDASDNRSLLSREQSAPSRKYWEAKRDGVVAVIAENKPEIVALQEIEGVQTLSEIISHLRSEHNLSYRFAFIQGRDSFTEQDVGLLVRGGLVGYSRREQSNRMFASQQFYNLSKHLIAEFRWDNVVSPLAVMTVHLRATADAEELRIKQARLARRWLEPELQAGEDVILLGDFNTEQPVLNSDEEASVSGDIAAIVGGEGQLRMVDLLTRLPDTTEATHLILDKQFDRIMVSESMMVDGEGADWCFAKIEVLRGKIVRGQPDGPAHWTHRLTLAVEEFDLSDHYPVMATFELR